MMTMIEEELYYVMKSSEDGWDEKYIMHVLPQPYTLPEQIIRTETLAIHSNMRMWQNDWVKEYFRREATPDEVALCQCERAKYGNKLQDVGEMVTGSKLETIEDSILALEKLVRS